MQQKKSIYDNEYKLLLESISKRLISLRTEKNLTQEEISFNAVIDRRTYSNIENNKTKDIELSTLFRIAKSLGKKVEDLFYNND